MHELVDPGPRADQADRVVLRVLSVRFADLAQALVDRLTEGAHVADVRTSVVYEHLRNDRIGPVG